MSADLVTLEAALGHRFKDREMLVRALTHSSRVHEQGAENPEAASGPQTDNEQLEFLGDAVLGFLISETLVRRFPSYPEGRLSKLKAHLVSAAHLCEVARKMELGQYLILGMIRGGFPGNTYNHNLSTLAAHPFFRPRAGAELCQVRTTWCQAFYFSHHATPELAVPLPPVSHPSLLPP